MIDAAILEHVRNAIGLHLAGIKLGSPVAYMISFYDEHQALTIEATELGLMKIWESLDDEWYRAKKKGYLWVRDSFNSEDQQILDKWFAPDED